MRAIHHRQSRARNLWRLRRYLRPYRWQFALSLVAAFLGTGVSIGVPLVVQRVVDGPIAERDPDGLLRLGGLALLLGIAEAVLIFVRRWVQSSQSLGMEATIRSDVYAHLQRLPISFHDGWQSGQLLSRVTADLSVIRRFLSFGLLFLVVNVATYVTVVGLLLHMHWPLGLLVAASSLPLVLVSRRFVRAYIVASRRMQDQQGDVATLVEESAQGLRTIKSFGRQPHMSTRFAAGASRLRDTAVGKGRLLARSSALFDLVPNLTLAAVLVGRRRRRRDRPPDPRRAGRVRHAPADAHLAGRVARVDHRATPRRRSPPRTGSTRCSTSAPSIVDRPGAVVVRRSGSRGEVRFDDVDVQPTRARRRRCCAASTSCCGRARRSPSSAPPGAARPRSPRWCPGSTT